MLYPKNLIIITEPRLDVISSRLRAERTGVHFTNGAYGASQHVVLPTTLSGFQYLHDRVAKPGDAFAIAVNSDRSMRNAGIRSHENQRARAEKILIDLAKAFPDRKVFGMFYHQETPKQLYARLKRDGVDLASLHKWGGYGIDGGPIIVGAEDYKRVIAFPFKAVAQRPAFFHVTPKGDQSRQVEVVDLYQTPKARAHGMYIK